MSFYFWNDLDIFIRISDPLISVTTSYFLSLVSLSLPPHQLLESLIEFLLCKHSASMWRKYWMLVFCVFFFLIASQLTGKKLDYNNISSWLISTLRRYVYYSHLLAKGVQAWLRNQSVCIQTNKKSKKMNYIICSF